MARRTAAGHARVRDLVRAEAGHGLERVRDAHLLGAARHMDGHVVAHLRARAARARTALWPRAGPEACGQPSAQPHTGAAALQGRCLLVALASRLRAHPLPAVWAAGTRDTICRGSLTACPSAEVQH
jgi:hypothetical protein